MVYLRRGVCVSPLVFDGVLRLGFGASARGAKRANRVFQAGPDATAFYRAEEPKGGTARIPLAQSDGGVVTRRALDTLW